MQIALGSASETEYHLLLAHDLGLLESEKCTVLAASIVEVKRMLTSLLKKIQARDSSGRRTTIDCAGNQYVDKEGLADG